LQLKRHVFHDVAGPGALSQSLQKAASFANAASVLDEPGQHILKPLVKTG
jgi:hypothetical protein